MRRTNVLLLCMLMSLSVLAQVDCTSKIVNPSFEQNLDGWTNDGMSAQSNSAFSLKVGNKYCEKWTGKGGKVGDASIRQTVTGLQAGLYTVTVKAQNIQEGTPTDVQTGVNVVANDSKTPVNVAAEYSVQTIIVDGQVKIAYELKGATGNYVTVDDFQLTLENATDDVYSKMHSMMQDIVDEAKAVSQNTGTAEQKELDAAREAVEALIKQQTSEGVTEAVNRLQTAIYDYRLSIASEEATVDMTDAISNPDFEKNGMEFWTNKGMWTQSGGVFPYAGNTFVEAWTWGGNTIGDVSICQRVTLPNGKYVLTAVSQNIQQGSNNAASKGGYIFAEEEQTEVGKAKDYTVTFVAIEGQANIGFKTVSATGNWVCVDNFRLTYLGRSEQMLVEALQKRITAAGTLAAEHMQNSVLKQLQEAISVAKAVTASKGMEQVSITLRESMEAAQQSIKAYTELQQAIATANSYHKSGTDDTDFLNAIAAAQKKYDEANVTEEQISDAISQLNRDILLYCVTNSTGTAPTVTTVSFVARGATGALGRSIVKGSNIMEKGFCWSKEHNPTVLDNRTTFSYDINGPMYLMQPLEPATVYYVRAYAMTKDYAVGYGEERKVITLPMGNSTYWYNWGGSPDENTRIDNALKDCIYYYNNWSCTTNFNISCSYGSGTPTADCSYGGSMRVGPNASYQRTGTILHESNHGVGVGQQGRWWDTSLHDGEWKGYRANSLLQFIENNPTSVMKGDNMHMWPYGINGASEDSGWPMLYIANVMITQALHEDGLIPPGHGGCKPAYVFYHDDDTKYYITSEGDSYGSGISYLTESSTGVLTWSEPTGSVADNDAYAWYFTYDPARQLYTIRNAKSGKYFSSASGIKTVKKTTLSNTEYFHLMVGRREKVVGSSAYGLTTRGYWIEAGDDVESPQSLTATAGGKTAAQSFNITDAAVQQRWLILTADEVVKAQNGKTLAYQSNLKELIKNLRKVADVPYVENVEGNESHTALTAVLDDMATKVDAVQDADLLKEMYDQTFQAGMDYLGAVSVADEEQPFDLTFLMTNPTIMEDTEGWTKSVNPGYNYNCAEYYQTSFDFNQTVSLPLGRYALTMQGFQRPGAYSSIWTAYKAGTYSSKINSTLYMAAKTAKLAHICDGGQTSKLGGTEQSVGSPAMYIPDNMQAAGLYFDKGLYPNRVEYTVSSTTKKMVSVKMGVKSTKNTDSGYWTIFRNFHLYFYGKGVETGIVSTTADELPHDATLYDLQGRRLQQVNRKGIYIKDGKLILVK